MVSDLRSCTMLSTLPLFYIAQSVNSDDRRTRIQGLRVIMLILRRPRSFAFPSGIERTANDLGRLRIRLEKAMQLLTNILNRLL